MNFYVAYLRTLPWAPRRAITALYWHLTGKKVRARNVLHLAAAQSPLAYRIWIETRENLPGTRTAANTIIADWHVRPFFSIIAEPGPHAGPRALIASTATVLGQYYSDWELLFFDRGSLWRRSPKGVAPVDAAGSGSPGTWLNTAIEAAQGDYVMPLRAGTRLSPTALFHFSKKLQNDSRDDVIFADHDRLNCFGRRNRPWFKPEWNEEMFLALDYLSDCCIIRRTSAQQAAKRRKLETVFGLLANIGHRPEARIGHVPRILAHLPRAERHDVEERLAALRALLADEGGTVAQGPFGSVRVSWPLPVPLPKVSIIIPIRDKVELLKVCLAGLLHRTDYDNVEIIVVDNDSAEDTTAAYLEVIGCDPRLTVLRYAGDFNYSAVNNFAVRQATGEYICLLNNDTDVIDASWLKEMVRHAVRSGIGAVGAKLLYADRTIQHAGVVIGLGNAAGHAHRFLKADRRGYFAQAHIPHYVSAVTAACLVVAKDKFDAVGGLDEKDFAIAYNDVDFCLRLDRAGWRNMYVPQAVLFHYESKSRGLDYSPGNIARFERELKALQTRWNTRSYRDPLLNPNLSRASETYLLDV